ncbi:MAG: VWA domain-containing protein [bacterium]
MKKLLTIFLLATSFPALADGIMKIKGQTSSYLRPERITVTSDINNQVCTTISQQTFVNRTSQPVWLQYGFPTNINASVIQFRWRAGGQWRTARVSGTPQDTSGVINPGGEVDLLFLDYLGEAPFLFAFRDSLPTDSTLTVELSYIELLKYRNGRVIYDYPLDMKAFAQHPLASFSLSLSLRSERDLVSLANPSHGAVPSSFTNSAAELSFAQNNLPAAQNFVVHYEVSQIDLGVFLLSHKPQNEDGFFIMLAEPDPHTSQHEIIDKIFTFIIDVSGSMAGQKIEQAKAAARFTVNNLNTDDRFNVIKFNSTVTKYRPNPVPATTAEVDGALSFIDQIQAGGGTELQSALLAGLGQQMSDTTANVIIFITDGIASLDQQTIITANTQNVRIFVFGIGNDVNKPLLTQLAANNNGIAEFLENGEVNQRISEFYAQIRDPLLQNINLAFTPTEVSEIYPLQLPDIYVGQQLIVLGRYTRPGNAQVALSGSTFGSPVRYEYAVSFTADSLDNLFLPRMWAKHKIDALFVLMSGVPEGSNQWEEWKREIIRLSLLYGILTLFTSFTDPGVPSAVLEEPLADHAARPSSFVLHQNFPNPFNPETRISYVLTQGPVHVTLRVYDLNGKLVRILVDEMQAPGLHHVAWDGQNDLGVAQASGYYFYVLEVGAIKQMKRMILLR